MVSRGDIWLVQLGGSGEQGRDGAHPCVILSPPEIHDHLGLVVVAPVTVGSKPAGFRVPVEFAGHDGIIRLEQIRSVETRLLTRQVGSIEPKNLATALATLREMFAE